MNEKRLLEFPQFKVYLANSSRATKTFTFPRIKSDQHVLPGNETRTNLGLLFIEWIQAEDASSDEISSTICNCMCSLFGLVQIIWKQSFWMTGENLTMIFTHSCNYVMKCLIYLWKNMFLSFFRFEAGRCWSFPHIGTMKSNLIMRHFHRWFVSAHLRQISNKTRSEFFFRFGIVLFAILYRATKNVFYKRRYVIIGTSNKKLWIAVWDSPNETWGLF